jgi:putative hydrolase of the HAD superfamily
VTSAEPTPIQAVLFDYGLVLTGPPDPAAWQRMQQITALAEPAFHAAYWHHRLNYDRGHYTGVTYWQAVGQHAGLTLSAAQLEALLEADTDLWTQPNQPMIDWALRLQAAGTRTGILSNLGDSMTAGALARLPWLAGFNHRLWSHALLTAKPDPAIYRASAEGLNTPPRAILFVDDREDNIAGALAAGMQAIRYAAHDAFVAELHRRGLGGLWTSGSTH